LDQAFVGAVEDIYSAAPDPSLWPQALQAIAESIGGIGANFFWRRDDGRFGLVVSTGMDPNSVSEYLEKWWRHDIRGSRAVEHSYFAAGSLVTDRDVVTDEEMATHPFFTQFLARYGLRWVAATGVSPDPRIDVAISVHGAVTRSPFSDGELARLGHLGTHAERSLRLSIRLLDAEMVKGGLSDALARIGIGVLALDASGRVLLANPVAVGLRADGVEIGNDRLHIGSGPDRAAFEAGLAALLRRTTADLTDEMKPILVRRKSSDRPLVVYLLPIRTNGNPVEAFLAHTRLIVLVVDPQKDDPPDPTLVRDVLGLTLGEARVAALVGAGLAPRVAAQRLGITEETTRTALKRVFSKVGVSRQSELAALLTKLLLR
jgi:DNA-binding CsgD family transcriptional regulator/PAS domain-containing protein